MVISKHFFTAQYELKYNKGALLILNNLVNIALPVLFVMSESYIVYRIIQSSGSGLPWALLADGSLVVFLLTWLYLDQLTS